MMNWFNKLIQGSHADKVIQSL